VDSDPNGDKRRKGRYPQRPYLRSDSGPNSKGQRQ